MLQGQFCFLKNQYYIDFPDGNLMKNKETIRGVSHNNPCFFAFPDKDNARILWLIPISSKVEKYRIHEQKKITRYDRCNTIRFETIW